MRVLGLLAPVAVALLLAIGAAETSVRYLVRHLTVVPEPGQKPNRFSPDDVLGYRLDRTAHWVQDGDRGEFQVEYWSTPEGFRTGKPGTPACRGDEVLCLGNSFVEGWGLPFEKSFLKVAEARLRAPDLPLGDLLPVRVFRRGVLYLEWYERFSGLRACAW